MYILDWYTGTGNITSLCVQGVFYVYTFETRVTLVPFVKFC